MQKDREIYLIDLMSYVLSKWKKILVIGVGVAIFAACFGFAVYSLSESDKNVQESTTQIEENSVNLDEESMTLEERLSLHAKSTALDAYCNSLEAYEEYLENSTLLDLNPTEHYKVVMNYVVAAEESGMAQIIAQTYADSIGTEEFFEKITAVTGKDLAHAESLVVGIYGNDSQETNNSGIRISFRHNDKNVCEEVERLITAVLKDKYTELQSSVSEHELKLLGAEVLMSSDWSLLSTRKGTVENKAAVSNAMAVLKNNMSKEELQYYRQSHGLDEVLESTETPVVVETSKPFTLKEMSMYLVLGFGGGVILCALVYCALYVLDAKIRNKRDLETCTGLPVLVTIQEDDTLEMIRVLIESYAQKENVGSIYVTGTIAHGELFSDKWNRLAQDLKEKGILLGLGESILNSPEAYEQCRFSDALLLVEQSGVSKFDAVNEQLQKLGYCDTKLMGAVLLK